MQSVRLIKMQYILIKQATRKTTHVCMRVRYFCALIVACSCTEQRRRAGRLEKRSITQAINIYEQRRLMSDE